MILLEQLKGIEGLLKRFKYLDKTLETTELIVDNYIALLVEKTKKCENPKETIRMLKINKLL